MSGIEVAGLVLGALPILFSAVDGFKQTLDKGQTFFKKRKYVEKLASALLLQQQSLAEAIRLILNESGCDDVSRLDIDPVGCLEDHIVQDLVLDYLGKANLAALTASIAQCHDTVQAVVSMIAELVPTVQGSSNLIRVIEANRQAAQRQVDLVSRLKLMFRFRELKNIIKDLDDSTNALSRFIVLVSSNRRPPTRRISERALKLAKALRQAHETASDLYYAILQGWRQQCHTIHEAKLFLEDRVVISKQSSCSPVFKLIFGAESLGGQREWHEAAVQAVEDEEQPERDSSTQHSRTSHRVTINIASVTHIRPRVSLIDNICAAIQPIQNTSHQLAIVLIKPQRIGTKPADGPMITSCACFETTSLHAILSNQANRQRHFVLSVRPRMLLALRLASNLLQLLQTQWLPNTWSHDNVYFRIRPTPTLQRQGQTDVDLDRPFISTPFSKDATPATLAEADPQAALLELGILLLEIWHEQTLEAHFPERCPAEYYERVALALRWLDEMDKPLPPLYSQAVSYCVQGLIGSEACLRQWSNIQFWNAFCAEVIQPLSDNCKDWI